MKRACSKLMIAGVVIAVVAIGLFIGGFFVPPMGEIDGSIISAAGELLGFVSVFMIWDGVDKAIKNNVDGKFSVGNVSVELKADDDDEEGDK